MVRVTFNGVEHSFKLNLAVLMATEAATAAIGEEKMSSFKTSLLLVYACLLQDEMFTMSYDEFLAGIDSQEELTKLFEALAAEQTRWAARNALTRAGSDETDEKKKR